jgi:hypothetical protein
VSHDPRDVDLIADETIVMGRGGTPWEP